MSSPSSAARERAKCPHCDLLLWESGAHAGTCWSCGKRPEEWQEQARPALSLVREEEEEMEAATTLESNGRLEAKGLDTVTGEVHGQLMLGLEVPRVAVQRKAETLMDEGDFNRHYWCFGAGDKLAVVERDGKLLVKMTTKGEE